MIKSISKNYRRMCWVVDVQCVQCDEHTEIELNNEQHTKLQLWLSGEGLIQNWFPELTPEQRELFISGVCPACWDAMFGGDNND